MKFEIRKAKKADVGALVEITKRTICECYSLFMDKLTVANYVEGDRVGNLIGASLSKVSVACVDGLPVGYIACDDSGISMLLVDVDSQKRGLGRSLLAHVDLMSELEELELRAEVYEANVGAVHFFEAMGWCRSRVQNDLESGFVTVFYEPLPQAC